MCWKNSISCHSQFCSSLDFGHTRKWLSSFSIAGAVGCSCRVPCKQIEGQLGAEETEGSTWARTTQVFNFVAHPYDTVCIYIYIYTVNYIIIYIYIMNLD